MEDEARSLFGDHISRRSVVGIIANIDTHVTGWRTDALLQVKQLPASQLDQMVGLRELDILKAEHAVMHEALTTWIGIYDNHDKEDVAYLEGAHSLAHNLLKELEDE